MALEDVSNILLEDTFNLLLEDGSSGFLLEMLDVISLTGLRPGGIGKGGRVEAKKRRILLPNGQVITPRSDREFREIIADIIDRPEPLVIPNIQVPKKLAKAKQKASKAVVERKPAYVPSDFLARLETQQADFVKYTEVLKAWETYWQAMQDDEDEIELLLVA